jgi:hypothetical protein
MEYKKLIDFDYTLCHTLEPLEGMRIWKEKQVLIIHLLAGGSS